MVCHLLASPFTERITQHNTAAPVVADAGGGGPAAAGDPAAAGVDRTEHNTGHNVTSVSQQQPQNNNFMERIALAAAAHGNVPVLRLLRGRGFVFRAGHLRACKGCRASLRYLLLEDPAADLAQGNDAAAGWCNEFRDAAVRGADLPLLQHLHEQLGASIDLVAVAKAGSEEALSWAVAALGAAGQAPESLSKGDFKSVLCYGNWAAADWMVRHGLAPPRQELLRHVLLEPPFLDLSRLTSIPTLQWVVGMRGGQDRVQVQWTAELHAALMYKRKTYAQGFGNETPCRLRWLAKLVETVGAELAGAAGGPPGAGATAASIAQS